MKRLQELIIPLPCVQRADKNTRLAYGTVISRNNSALINEPTNYGSFNIVEIGPC